MAPDAPQLNSLATNAVPQIPGISGGRYWGDQPPQDLAAQVAEMKQQRRASGAGRPEITVLAISGGADYGAFGAGVLSGWTKTGTREQGSWWPHWVKWITERGGGEVDAPKTLGDATHKPLGPAPGTYVFEP